MDHTVSVVIPQLCPNGKRVVKYICEQKAWICFSKLYVEKQAAGYIQLAGPVWLAGSLLLMALSFGAVCYSDSP